MCQRVNRYLQKRLVALRDEAAQASRAIASAESGAEMRIAEANYGQAQTGIREIEAVLRVMEEPPARVIAIEDAAARVAGASAEPHRAYDKVSRFELPESLMHAVDATPQPAED